MFLLQQDGQGIIFLNNFLKRYNILILVKNIQNISEAGRQWKVKISVTPH